MDIGRLAKSNRRSFTPLKDAPFRMTRLVFWVGSEQKVVLAQVPGSGPVHPACPQVSKTNRNPGDSHFLGGTGDSRLCQFVHKCAVDRPRVGCGSNDKVIEYLCEIQVRDLV